MRLRYFIFCIAVIMTFCCCHDRKSSTTDQTDGEEKLNLTKNALWDDPVLSEDKEDSLDNLVWNSSDSAFFHKINDFDNDKIPRDEAMKLYPRLKTDLTTRYDSYIRMYLLNDLMVTLPESSIKPDSLKYYLEECYRNASSKNPLPLSLFMHFWSNCMVMYSNIDCTDSIFAESARLLRICQSQNIPQGLLCTYKALGDCLYDLKDFTTAAKQYEIAEEIAKKYFPTLLGNNWETDTIDISDIASQYLGMVALHVRCCNSSNNLQWIDDNEKLLLHFATMPKEEDSHLDIVDGLARYYDIKDNDRMYQKMIDRGWYIIKKYRFAELSKDYNYMYKDYSNHLSVIADHYLKKHDTENALKTMNMLPDAFFHSAARKPQLAKLYMLQGRYEEAAKVYEQLDSINDRHLNGRNRNTLASLSSRIESESKEMEIIKMQLEQEKKSRIYESMLLGAAALLIVVLIFYYYRQRKQNEKLAIAYKAANDAYEEAKKANDAKDIFLKNMDHELHTPLNFVYGFAQILADESMPLDDATTREMAGSICQGAEQLTTIIDNMVDVTDKLSKLDKLEDVATILQTADFKKKKKTT